MAPFSPRRGGVLVSVFLAVFFLLFFFKDSLTYTTIDKGLSLPPRPPYPPFQPPPSDEHLVHPVFEHGPVPPLPAQGAGPSPNADTAWPAANAGSSALVWKSRAESVKEAFLHAYTGYEKYAPFPSDELLPLSNKGIQNFNGWGVTMVDALDTMLLMGLTDQYARAISHVASLNFTMRAGTHAPFFETVIRYLGGLLSAYALSNEPIMLIRATELGEKLLPAFNTTSGLPAYGVNTQTKEVTPDSTVLLAEMASCQMEYKYLAHITGRKDFFEAADKIMDIMEKTQDVKTHMWPTLFSTSDGMPLSTVFTVAALSDSAYEYLLKQYLLSNKTESRLASLYVSSMDGVLSNLMYLSPTRNLLYVTDSYSNPPYPTRKFEHLACFLPGLLALGVSTLPDSVLPPSKRELHLWAAQGLAHTCWLMYAESESGLGAELVMFDNDLEEKQGQVPRKWIDSVLEWERGGKIGAQPPGVVLDEEELSVKGSKRKDYSIHIGSYLLRPETLESMYVMYRTTRDPKWRDRGWQIWDAIATKTRTQHGFASVTNIDRQNPIWQESMPSYFLAETVKYAYLLTLDSDPLPESDFVFNTEAHPLPVFQWRDWERKSWRIK